MWNANGSEKWIKKLECIEQTGFILEGEARFVCRGLIILGLRNTWNGVTYNEQCCRNVQAQEQGAIVFVEQVYQCM